MKKEYSNALLEAFALAVLGFGCDGDLAGAFTPFAAISGMLILKGESCTASCGTLILRA